MAPDKQGITRSGASDAAESRPSSYGPEPGRSRQRRLCIIPCGGVCVSFRVLADCASTAARAAVFSTPHGDLLTPAFMPVGTQATVRGLTPENLRTSGAHCVLANAYHLALRPGSAAIARLGGLHRFMGWPRTILTDSGGFQVHSLARFRETSDRGVRFLSHLDGSALELTPESVVRTQEELGADIIMPLDVCLGATAGRDDAEAGLERTRRWLDRSLVAHSRDDQQLFGIVQGSLDAELRRQAARDLRGLDLPGYAIGGLSVGESNDLTEFLVGVTTTELPAERPRYLMGVGTPEQVVRYAALGIDMFDCVLPTRFGRTGVAFSPDGRLNLRRAHYQEDIRPIDPRCDCAACGRYSRAALHAYLRSGAPLGGRLVSLHNIRCLIRTAESARAAILSGTFPKLLARLGGQAGEVKRLVPRWPVAAGVGPAERATVSA